MKKQKYTSIKELFDAFSGNEKANNLHFLYHLVAFFRPKNKKQSVSLSLLLYHLEHHSEDATFLRDYLEKNLSDKKFGSMISQVGISHEADFFVELKKRISNKILPFQPEKDTMEYVLNQVFYKTSDIDWIQRIPFAELEELFDILCLDTIFSTQSAVKGMLSEVLYGIGLLTQRMGGRSVEANIIKMAPEYSYLESPFLGLEKEFTTLQEGLLKGEFRSIETGNLDYKHLLILHKQCYDFVKQAYKNSAKYGITLKVNQGLLCLEQQLQRVETLLQLLVADTPEQRKQNSISLALKLIELNSYKSDISDFFKDSIQLVSYEITQHSAVTGEKYITESNRGYFKMLKASLGGGFIVGFMCLTKILLGKIETSDFGHAVLYSLNYAVGFCLIYLLHYTLATKQPAMTAATIISAIEKGLKLPKSDSERHTDFARLFARLFRSQFIAFIGNIVMAFPVALLLVWGISYFLDINVVAYKWHTLLKDASPIHSPLIFHAAIAGVFLFLSGIISGNVSNTAKHNNLYYRIAENPTLKRTFGERGALKLSKWMEKKWAGLVSNIWFGIFMGSTASIGIFFGLNLDIRHITFVSGNIAMGLFGANFDLHWSVWLWSFTGMVLVGAINFMVSFSLSLYLAFSARNIHTSELFSLAKAVFLHFKKEPISFFFPKKDAL